MKFILSALAASLMLTAISCKRPSDNSAAKTVTTMEMSPSAGVIQQEEEGIGQEQKSTDQAGVNKIDQNWDKKIIKTAVMNIEVEDFIKYNNEIKQVAEKSEGYISKEEQKDSDYKKETSLTIKVPAERFDETVKAISSLKGKSLTRQISSQDVTGEVVDVRTRVQAKKRIRLRYLDMLQKAKNIEEILQVEREINQVQEQIEAAEARLDYLSHSAAYSSIQLTFFQVIDPKAVDRENPGFARKFMQALTDGVKWSGDIIIFFTSLWPLWVFLVFTIWMIKRSHLRIKSA